MDQQQTFKIASEIFSAVEKLIPGILSNPEDEQITNGNTAICIIDPNGSVFGRTFGSDLPKQRQSFKIAWTKASQVWLTGVATGEYERMVFNNEIPENANGIDNPDLIGWVGGQPLMFNDLHLSVGFSGFRGTTDLKIVQDAFNNINLNPVKF